MLFLFYVNVSGMHLQSRFSSLSLTILAPWVPLRIWWSTSLVPPWVTATHFLAGNREAKLKAIIFSSLLIFLDFTLSSFPDPRDIVLLSVACSGYS